MAKLVDLLGYLVITQRPSSRTGDTLTYVIVSPAVLVSSVRHDAEGISKQLVLRFPAASAPHIYGTQGRGGDTVTPPYCLNLVALFRSRSMYFRYISSGAARSSTVS